ncbi:MAG: 50S ribosomal protein L13 [Elusimicrobiota bacterium]
MKTYLPKKEDIQKKWYHLNAEGKVLGRLAVRCVGLLRGKGKVCFTPSVDTGDFVVVTNVEKMKITGKKLQQKVLFRHSGYPGGAKFTGYEKMMEDHPERVLYLAVKGMLPRNRLSDRLLTKLKIYRGAKNPHAVQKPETI